MALRGERRAALIALAAVLLAAPLGLLAATEARTWALAAIGGAVVAGATATGFRRDPVLVVVALWAFQIVRTPLAVAVPQVDQLSDVVLLVVLIALAVDLLSPSAPPRDLRLFAPAIGLLFFGLASSAAQSAPLAPTLTGAWLGTKFWLLVGASVAIPWRAGDLDRALAIMAPIGAIAALLGLVDFATGGAVADALRSNLRVTPLGTYRSGAAQSLYAHPNEYSLAMSLLVALFLARLATRARARASDVALVVLFVAAAVVSLRLKAVLSVTAAFAVVAVVQIARGRRGGVGLLAGGAVVVLAVFLAMGSVIGQQLNTYGSSQTSVRAQLYDVGARIADDHAPFGVGFGRYASAPSRDHYSPVYDLYGLSRVWGLSRDFPRFVADTSWPSVMGETGYGGLAVFAAGLLALALAAVVALRRARGSDALAPLALSCALVVLLVDSTGNPNLFSWNAITVIALLSGATLAQLPARARAREPALA